MVRKKNRQVIWRWKYTTNHCQRENIGIFEKEKTVNLVIPIEKNQKTRNWLVKKPLLVQLSYIAKSAQH